MPATPATIETVGGKVIVDATSFRPDWTMTGTKYTLTNKVGFEWKGEGWYFTKGVSLRNKEPYKETMLIIPTFYGDNDEDAPVNPEDRTYLLCMYNHDAACNAFNWIVNARVAVDER